MRHTALLQGLARSARARDLGRDDANAFPAPEDNRDS